MTDESKTTPRPRIVCACPSTSARLCIALRSGFACGHDDERCTCICHDEPEDDDDE